MATVLPFNGFYKGNSPKNSSRECVNYIPVKHDAGSYSQYTLDSTSGITNAISGISYEKISNPFPWNLAGYDTTAFSFVVDDATGYRIISSDGYVLDNDILNVAIAPSTVFGCSVATSPEFAIALIKTLNFSSGFESNAIGLKSDGTGVGKVSLLPSGVLANDIAYLGGRFIYMSVDGGVQNAVYYSDIGDPLTVDPLGYFSDTAQPSSNAGIHVLNDRLYLFSSSSFSVWSVTSSVNLPFSKQSGSSGSIGLFSNNAKTEVSGSLYFIGMDNGKPSLYVMNGGVVTNISNEYIDNKLTAAREIDLFSITDNGKNIVCINTNVGTEKTLCYDLSTGECHTRSSVDGSEEDSKWNVYGAVNVVNSNGVECVVFGQPNNDEDEVCIARLDTGLCTEFGSTVSRELVTSIFNSNGVTNNLRELSIDISVDEPVPSADDGDISISVSNDRGSSYLASRSHAIGSYNGGGLARFMNFGIFRDSFMIKLSTNTEHPHKLLKMFTRLEKGFRQI